MGRGTRDGIWQDPDGDLASRTNALLAYLWERSYGLAAVLAPRA